MTRRGDIETLRLARDVAEEALSSPALDTSHGDVRFAVSLELAPDSTMLVIGEPERRAPRDLLVVLRKFDMPSHDANLRRVYPIVERADVKPEWREGLTAASRAFDSRDQIDMFKVQEPGEAPPEGLAKVGQEPTWVRPREAFELWVYGEVVHDDYAKEQRWKAMSPFHQAPLRHIAHEYMFELLRQADFIARLVRHGLAEPL